MKIALIIHELLVEGGGERQCVSLARALDKQGHEVTLFTSAYDSPKCFPEVCKALKVVETGRGRWPSISKPRFLRGYLDMRNLATVVNEKYEIWHPHHWPSQWAAVWIKQKLGGQVLWMCNDVPEFFQRSLGTRKTSSKNLFSSFLQSLYYHYDRRQNRKVDKTLFLSRWAEGEYRAIYPGPTQVVRSGMDPEAFSPGGNREQIRSRFSFKDEEFVLLWLGIFMPHRRLEDAIQATALLKSRGINVRMLFAGSDRSFPEYLKSLIALAKDLEVEDKVTFAGKVEEREVRDFYCSCDAFLFPNDQQTWGLAVLEAMACGCPVLVSRGAGVYEVLTDRENAFLFWPRNPESLADNIELVMKNPQQRISVSKAGMRLVNEQFNWDRFADQISFAAQQLLPPNKLDSIPAEFTD